MKFNNVKDAQMFLVEVGKSDMISEVKSTDWKPSQELVLEFIKARKPLLGGLKNLKRSAAAKATWRGNRYGMMKGIKSFHKSTEGKRFHRSLGRYLATRISKSGRHESYDEKYESLKSLSSLRTHLYIDTAYFKELNEQVEFEMFMDEIVPVTLAEELNIYKNDCEMTEENLDILCRAIEPTVLVQEYCSVIGKAFDASLVDKFININEETSFVQLLKEIT